MNKKGFVNTTLIVSIVAITVVVGYLIISRPSIKYPIWLKTLIAKLENEPVANPPASLTRCEYKSKTVYYLPPRCCDIASILYNANGNIICAPDGGFIGTGDGKCPDFFETKKNCQIIWQDNR